MGKLGELVYCEFLKLKRTKIKIIALLIKVLSGNTPDDIINADLYFIDKIGLKDHLSPTRSNGLVSMIKQIRNYALAFKLKS